MLKTSKTAALKLEENLETKEETKNNIDTRNERDRLLAELHQPKEIFQNSSDPSKDFTASLNKGVTNMFRRK